MFWFLVICAGFVGAVADVLISYWSQTNRLVWWLAGAAGSLGFVTGLGLIIRLGVIGGHTLTVALVLVVLVNVAFVAAWDVIYNVAGPTTLQWLGIVLALGAVVCLELGRK
ncbi:MAG: hypothetical protein Q7R69_02560 [bacterium]|nr:hypothetical protein [bacterium]